MFKKAFNIFIREGPRGLIKKVSRKLYRKKLNILFHPSSGNGLNIIGNLKYAFGNSETARSFAKKSRLCNMDFALFNIESELHNEINPVEMEDLKGYFSEELPYDKNIFFMNGNLIPSLYRDYPALFKNRYNSAVWWWEFDSGMESYIPAFRYLDEIVVYTDFVKKSLLSLPSGKCKITRLVYPFLKNWEISKSKEELRKKYNISESDFVFIFSFDYFSGFERKNPFALLEAFSHVFSDRKDVRLILKTSHRDSFKDKADKITKFVMENKLEKKIIIIDEIFIKDDLMSLFNSADCYISLHRGEGLGIGMLEAMSLGKPVIGTKYGGNMEFMNEDNSFPVDYKMVKAKDDYSLYKDVQYWAEPDLLQAGSYMEELYLNRDTGKNKGEKARDFVWNLYNLEDFETGLRDFVK